MISPRGKRAVIEKSPRYGNVTAFSTGNVREEIVAWEVPNSTLLQQIRTQSKVVADQVTKIVRTHSALGGELQSDDALTFDGYTYSVQTVRPVPTCFTLDSKDWEIALK